MLVLSSKAESEGGKEGIVSCCTLMGCSVPSNLDLSGLELTS